MKGRELELARRWLDKAWHDILTAEAVLRLPNGPTDTPCFHAQQAAEKALKGLLTAKRIVFYRTHDLIALFDALDVDKQALEGWREKLAILSQYAVEVRYPASWDEPDREEAERSLKDAEAFVRLVEGLINQLQHKSQ